MIRAFRKVIFNILSGSQLPEILNYIRHRSKRFEITVLCFHRIHPTFNPIWSPIHPELFEKLIVYLKDHYEIIPLSRTSDKTKSVKPRLVISFDDGYKDFIEYALPVLQKHNIPCNHNIVVQCAEKNQPTWTQVLIDYFLEIVKTKWEGILPLPENHQLVVNKHTNYSKRHIELLYLFFEITQIERENVLKEWSAIIRFEHPHNEYMNWEEIRQCAESGVEIGCHTWSHDVLKRETREKVLKQEILNAKQAIEEKIGREVLIIAMPNGQINDIVETYIKQCGFRQILLVGDKIYNNTVSHLIPRINMIQEPFAEMKLRVAGFHSLAH